MNKAKRRQYGRFYVVFCELFIVSEASKKIPVVYSQLCLVMARCLSQGKQHREC